MLGIAQGHSFRLDAMVLEHNDRLARVGVASSEALGTYAVEDAFELEMPTRVLGLDEAGEWLIMIADNEGVDHPVISQMAMSRSLQGLAFVDEWCISVRKKKMSIYVVIQPNKLAESRLIVNLFFSQLINVNTKVLPQNDASLKHQCLLLMDEFTSIGRVDIIASAVSFMAGYNLRLMPIIQSMAQLESTYGKENARTIMTNHALRIIFAPREQQDANEYSEMLGYTAMRKDSVSRSRSRDSSYTRSESDERRALMLPQELKALGDDKQILLVEGMAHPVMAEKSRYFKEAAFKERLLPKVEVPMLDLPGSLPKAFSTEANAPVHRAAVEQDASPVVHQSVESSLAQQYEAHRQRTPEAPGEYTGLAGIQREVDGVMSLLER